MNNKKHLTREIITTQDGSKTLFIPEWNEQYHSKHGALQESEHVFIQKGWKHYHNTKKIRIFEMGFGTGLNCFLTYLHAQPTGQEIHYTGIEKYPLKKEEWMACSYAKDNTEKEIWKKIHEAEWGKSVAISPSFFLNKQETDIHGLETEEKFDIVYFDAFGIRVQPDLWTEEVFAKMYSLIKDGGLLTTYAANGKAKRALQSVGFTVEKIPGPPGKREMMNAWKK